MINRLLKIILLAALAALFVLVLEFSDAILTAISDEGVSPRSICWAAKNELLAPNSGGHALIALASFAIGARFFLIAWRRGRRALTFEFAVYAALIVLLGATHASALALFFYPVATADTIILSATGIVSILACVRTYRVGKRIESAADFDEVAQMRQQFEEGYKLAMRTKGAADRNMQILYEAAQHAFDRLEQRSGAAEVLTGIHTTHG